MANPPKPTNARAYAIHLLSAVLDDRRALEDAIAAQPFAGSAADERFAQMLVLTVFRHLGQIDALLATCLEKPLPAKRRAITNALRIGAAQLLWLATPAHAAVHETVAAIKHGKDAGLTGLVNAVLQKLARNRPTLPEPIHNLPAWLRARWESFYGPAAVAAIAQVAARRPPLDLNTLADMPDATRLDAEITRLPSDHAAVETLPGYDAGAFFVQDLAASYPVRLLGEVRGLRVLDLCAAPGGKTAQLARRGAVVTALDRSPARMAVLSQNQARLKFSAEIIAADLLKWQPQTPYDAILLDAPCSATGTWRRHPEVVHAITPEAIDELAAQQRLMLARAWGWLKPGGRMVYAVCSLEREEGEAQAEWFTAQHADAIPLPASSQTDIAPACIRNGMLRSLPSDRQTEGGMDGFFAVAFEKRV